MALPTIGLGCKAAAAAAAAAASAAAEAVRALKEEEQEDLEVEAAPRLCVGRWRFGGANENWCPFRLPWRAITPEIWLPTTTRVPEKRTQTETVMKER